MNRALLLYPLIAAGCAYAQAALGVASLRGTVEDQSGAVVPDARIFLRHETKGLERVALSDSGGSFLFAAVIAGIYSVRVEKPGFAAQEMQGVRIDVGEQASVAIALTPGEVRTAITVT